MVHPDFIVSDPDEYWWLDDLRKGGQVIWAHFVHSVFGKNESYWKNIRSLLVRTNGRKHIRNGKAFSL